MRTWLSEDKPGDYLAAAEEVGLGTGSAVRVICTP